MGAEDDKIILSISLLINYFCASAEASNLSFFCLYIVLAF